MRATANTATVRNYPVIGREFEGVMHEAANAARAAKGAAWLCTAPFIGLVYVVALPLAGLGALAWLALKALAARWKTAARVARNIALFFVAPFVGLAYAVAFPFVGVGMLAWWALRAATRRGVAR
ncbi:MAG: hypothetical protein A3H34_07195 [Betaproteobacteria bacterium RIFCSPLOWO2_02_FULL_67_19]|nr:MAG: hypothetical protein A3H34_07195 [Betaproteobacteria bacterium RIFCSPLOWO2_02_FULL_67_19]